MRPTDQTGSRAAGLVRHLAAADLRLAEHAHAAYTVATVLRGTLEIAVGAGAEALTLHAGQSALIGVDVPHAARLEQCELVSVGLKPSAVDALLVAFGWHHPLAAPVFRAPVADDPQLLALAQQFADELGADRPGQATMLDALLQQVGVCLLRTHLVVRRTANLERTRFGPVDRRLRRAVELMHVRLAEDVGLTELAEAVSLSTSHFAHLFKELVGQTPYAYLTNIRIEHARALLADSELPITEIASRVGFRSPGHFASAFKATVGATPSAYRNNARG